MIKKFVYLFRQQGFFFKYGSEREREKTEGGGERDRQREVVAVKISVLYIGKLVLENYQLYQVKKRKNEFEEE